MRRDHRPERQHAGITLSPRGPAWDRAAWGLPLLAVLPLVVRALPPHPGLGVLRVFAAPLAALAVFGLLCGLFLRVSRGSRRWRIERLEPWFQGRRGVLIVFLVVLAAVSVVRAQFISARPDDPRREHLLTGDEPTYLLLAHSLVFDHDLNVFNNREQNDARYFYSRPLLGEGQFGFTFYNRVSGGRLAGREREWVGREYLVNRPGISLLIAPAYWLGFRWGLRIRFVVLVWLNLVAATLAAVMFVLARHVSRAPVWSGLAALLLALSPPLLYYSSQVYPDLAAGLFLAGAVLGLAVARHGTGVFLTGLLVACLPWFNERFLAPALLLAAAALFRAPVRRQLSWFALPILVSLVLQGVYYWRLFGIPLPPSAQVSPPSPAAIPTGLLAILTDRDRGVLLLSPMLLLTPLGMLRLWRLDRWLAGTIGSVVALYLATVASFTYWHAGTCPPLRYVAPITPLLVVPLVLLLRDTARPLTRASLAALGAWGLWLGVRLVARPGLMFWAYGAVFRPQPLQPAHLFFPGYFHPAPGSVWRSLVWLGFLALIPGLDWGLARAGIRLTPRLAWLSVPFVFAAGLVAVSFLSAAVALPG